MNPFQRAAMNLAGGPCNAAPILTKAQASNAARQTVPQPSLPRVTLIPGDPARSHTLDSYTTCVDIGPGMSEETTHEVIHHFEATPERVQIDLSKADAQLLQGLLANLTKRNRGLKLDNLSSALHQALPARHYGCVIIDGVQVSVSEVFPQLY